MKDIFRFAVERGWKIISMDKLQKMVVIKKDDIKIDVWCKRRKWSKLGIGISFYEEGLKTIHKKGVRKIDLKELLVDINYIKRIK